MPVRKSAPPTEPAQSIVPPAEPVVPVPVPVPLIPATSYIPPRPLRYGSDKPGMVTAIVFMTLLNGILNILWGLGASHGAIAGLVTICLTPFTILPTVLGIFEIIYATKLLSNPPQPVQPSRTIAILEICCILAGNVFSLIVGILALVFYDDFNVKTYFARLNGQA